MKQLLETKSTTSIDKTTMGLDKVDNSQQIPMSQIDNDTSLSSDSTNRIPTQYAVKTYIDQNSGSSNSSDNRILFDGLLSDIPTQQNTDLSTWINQGTAVLSENTNGITLSDDQANAINAVDFGILVKSVPTTPYTITALVSYITYFNSDNPQMGFGQRDSTSGKMHGIAQFSSTTSPHSQLSVSRQSGYSAQVSAETNYYPAPQPFAQLQLYNDGTTVSFGISPNGTMFRNIFSVTKSSGYLGNNGYNQIWFGINPQGNTIKATLMSYKQT